MTKQTTKQCPKCGNTNLLLLSTYNMKVCVNHKEHVKIPWVLDKGQKRLYDQYINRD